MDLRSVVYGRRSIRRFKKEPVNIDDIRYMVEMATKAPSANNMQPWKFIVILNEEVKQKLKDAVEKKFDEFLMKMEDMDSKLFVKGYKNFATFFAEAPAVIMVFCEKYESKLDSILRKWHIFPEGDINDLRGRPDIQSVAAAIQNLILAAYDKGYGTCWMCAPNVAAQEIREILGLEEKWMLCAVIPVGRPNEDPKERPRKPLEEVLEIIE